MKSLRNLASILLLLSGVLHLVSVALMKFETTSIISIVFGLVYLVLGILLFQNNRAVLWSAAIVPLLGLLLAAIGMIMNPTLLGAVFILLDLIISGCCFYLISRKV